MNIRAQGATWRERLVAVLVSYTEVLYEHPGLARTAMLTRPSGPNSLNVWEALLGLLDEGGSAVGEAAWGADLLLQPRRRRLPSMAPEMLPAPEPTRTSRPRRSAVRRRPPTRT